MTTKDNSKNWIRTMATLLYITIMVASVALVAFVVSKCKDQIAKNKAIEEKVNKEFNITPLVEINGVSFEEITINDHKYVAFKGHNRGGLTHSPDCNNEKCEVTK